MKLFLLAGSKKLSNCLHKRIRKIALSRQFLCILLNIPAPYPSCRGIVNNISAIDSPLRPSPWPSSEGVIASAIAGAPCLAPFFAAVNYTPIHN